MEIGGVTIYHPFGEFHRGNSYCHLFGTQGQRGVLLAPCHDEFPTRGPLQTDLINLNHGQATSMTPELVLLSFAFHTSPTGGRLSLDLFNVHCPSARLVFRVTRLELMTHQLRVRDLDH
ncbi:hypothetical protein TNCV_3750341 [Trichonephila clavipes]|nr:hypothetical protein TNCV_3750341 [Trichonephila clavipes]